MKQFGCFQLDTQNECLWQNGVRLGLTPKPFAVLRYLVENPQRLITHDELLNKLWPDTFVQPQVLRTYVLELRKLLGDQAENPRFIRTDRRRGFWFIADVEDGGRHAAGSAVPQPGGIVGRRHELDKMHALLRQVKQGERQVLFITGEAGIGKTSLIDAFCSHVSSENRMHIARGQSVEGFAGKEAYYPVMEVLGQLCTRNEGEKNARILQQKAPSWYTQLASPLPPDDSPAVAGSVKPDRMLNEICDAVEEMSVEKTMVLVFEDLHWADLATLDLISALARRRSSVKLLLLASYRPADVSTGQHPLKQLKQDLDSHKLSTEAALRPLEKAAVSEYLVRELKQGTLPNGLASFVHQHSEGNPLFMTAMLEHLIAEGYIREEAGCWQLRSELAEIDLGVPKVLSEMIEMQIERLDATDQRLLEAASLIGVIFPAWAAAAALGDDLEDIEEQYEKMTRRMHFLHPAGHDQLPDGTQSAFYVFAHELYREVLRNRQSPARRARRHLRVAERLEKLFAGRESDVSHELAMHFEAAAEWVRAAQALSSAAEMALQRGARNEGVKLVEQALRILENLNDQDRAATETKIRERFRAELTVKKIRRKLDGNLTLEPGVQL
jgi:predicted ATPase